jgi:hypothetical protein
MDTMVVTVWEALLAAARMPSTKLGHCMAICRTMLVTWGRVGVLRCGHTVSAVGAHAVSVVRAHAVSLY